MTTLLRLFCAACLLAAFTASATPPGANVIHASYTMLPGDSVPVGPDTPTLRYDRADDSRCPPNVQCIWAGTITYEFSLIGAIATETFSLTPAKPDFDSVFVPGLHIGLAEFTPPPVPPVGAPKPPYPVTITVDRLDAAAVSKQPDRRP